MSLSDFSVTGHVGLMAAVLWLLLYVFDVEYLFLGSFYVFFTDGCSAVNLILVCFWEEVTPRPFYSAVLSPSLMAAYWNIQIQNITSITKSPIG